MSNNLSRACCRLTATSWPLSHFGVHQNTTRLPGCSRGLSVYTSNESAGLVDGNIRKAVRAALGNSRHQALFTELLFRSNAALRVSNDVVLWATQVFVPAEFDLIEILLAYDSTPRQFSLTDLERILTSGCSRQHLASLVSSDPNLKLDQHTLTMAVHAASLSDADAKMLLDRTAHMTLTM
ncbi:uncharacterized protein BO72DRAFT_448883 [Aspergillus fijiensis CBS 313.89]|uniref:Uncharacterized protein n=1 Tax=Aspergillus fijiensis CBS 313.89 TaxID=1448319 RepID=A0A8G1W0U0_9EURO|nr:uncharacterized protein BO72DRAFT_448883 [Aspergillus fijiensis CBS 313.89]RAK76369.1 hypothetical protein BO72DRAFT_448883 [Aspergillus fijiensis CBS 313.89]